MSKRHTSELEQVPKRLRRSRPADKSSSVIASLSEQNDKLSRQNLLLSKLYRAAYRLLPDSLRVNVDQLRREMESIAGLEDVHP